MDGVRPGTGVDCVLCKGYVCGKFANSGARDAAAASVAANEAAADVVSVEVDADCVAPAVAADDADASVELDPAAAPVVVAGVERCTFSGSGSESCNDI